VVWPNQSTWPGTTAARTIRMKLTAPDLASNMPTPGTAENHQVLA
jgi:hypothetical protein